MISDVKPPRKPAGHNVLSASEISFPEKLFRKDEIRPTLAIKGTTSRFVYHEKSDPNFSSLDTLELTYY